MRQPGRAGQTAHENAGGTVPQQLLEYMYDNFEIKTAQSRVMVRDTHWGACVTWLSVNVKTAA